MRFRRKTQILVELIHIQSVLDFLLEKRLVFIIYIHGVHHYLEIHKICN